MGADLIVNFDSIRGELEKAKNNLKGLNDNIRRIVGRDPPDAVQLRGDRKRSFGSGAAGGPDEKRRSGFEFGQNEKSRRHDHSPPSKRRHTINPDAKSVFSRLSGPPPRHHNNNNSHGGATAQDEGTKPKLNSRVIREMPTRQEIVEAQGTDAASKARNRRMFGSLMGTLQKFCQEESRLKPKEDLKAQIEKKLEEQQLQERETMKRERQDLFQNRKRQQVEIKMLETKMNRMKELATWEEAQKPRMNFVLTKAKPHIYYLPKVMDAKVEQKLAESRADLDKTIAKKRAQVTEELAHIENRFRSADPASNRDATNGAGHQEHSSPSHPAMNKHDRHSPHEDDEDEDDEPDSPYHQSDEADLTLVDEHDISMAPDISLVKKESDLEVSKPAENVKDMDCDAETTEHDGEYAPKSEKPDSRPIQSNKDRTPTPSRD